MVARNGESLYRWWKVGNWLPRHLVCSWIGRQVNQCVTKCQGNLKKQIEKKKKKCFSKKKIIF
jgi:hypothetical protein